MFPGTPNGDSAFQGGTVKDFNVLDEKRVKENGGSRAWRWQGYVQVTEEEKLKVN